MTRTVVVLKIVVIIVSVALIALGIWSFNVATSKIKGEGDAVINKNSAANWPKQQAEFERLFASIKSQDKNIGLAYEDLQGDPKNTIKQTNYSGLIRNCNDTVGAYDAKAREFNAKDFRSADLPERIDQSNPATDCKEG